MTGGGNGNAVIDWEAIHGLMEDAIYGGRIDNAFDLRVLRSYLRYQPCTPHHSPHGLHCSYANAYLLPLTVLSFSVVFSSPRISHPTGVQELRSCKGPHFGCRRCLTTSLSGESSIRYDLYSLWSRDHGSDSMSWMTWFVIKSVSLTHPLLTVPPPFVCLDSCPIRMPLSCSTSLIISRDLCSV